MYYQTKQTTIFNHVSFDQNIPHKTTDYTINQISHLIKNNNSSWLKARSTYNNYKTCSLNCIYPPMSKYEIFRNNTKFYNR